MNKVPHTSAYLKVNACFAVAARAFESWFAEPNTMPPDGLAFKKSNSFQALYAPLKVATQQVDSTTRTYVRTVFGIMYSKFEKAWAARNEKLQEGFRYYACANVVLRVAVAAAIESSVKEVNDYLTKRIENKNRCEALKRLLDGRILHSSGDVFYCCEGKRYVPREAIIPRSFRSRWELWMVTLFDVDTWDFKSHHAETFLRDVMDEAVFYDLAKLVFAELETAPLVPGDVPPNYPYPLDRKPNIPEWRPGLVRYL